MNFLLRGKGLSRELYLEHDNGGRSVQQQRWSRTATTQERSGPVSSEPKVILLPFFHTARLNYYWHEIFCWAHSWVTLIKTYDTYNRIRTISSYILEISCIGTPFSVLLIPQFLHVSRDLIIFIKRGTRIRALLLKVRVRDAATVTGFTAIG
jgi:hypothetical protein